jgi:predicted  nucleic acid-binding Zn-ribbon protein
MITTVEIDEISVNTCHGARFVGNAEGLKIAEDHATMQDRLTAIEMSIKELKEDHKELKGGQKLLRARIEELEKNSATSVAI